MNYYAVTSILMRDGTATTSTLPFETSAAARQQMYQFFAQNIANENVDTLFAKVVTPLGDIIYEETFPVNPSEVN